jgi:hypothetical protein
VRARRFAGYLAHPLKSSYICDHRQELEHVRLVEISPQNPLAAPYLAACGRRYAGERRWSEARLTFTRLQRDLPASREVATTTDDLARAIAAYQPVAGEVLDHGQAVDLHRPVGVPGLHALRRQDGGNCDVQGNPVVLTVPPGRYTVRLQYYDPDYPERPEYLSKATWNLKAGQEYDQCFWVYR